MVAVPPRRVLVIDNEAGRVATAIAAASLPGGSTPFIQPKTTPLLQYVHWRRTDGRVFGPACDRWALGPTATATSKVTCPTCRAAIPRSN